MLPHRTGSQRIVLCGRCEQQAGCVGTAPGRVTSGKCAAGPLGGTQVSWSKGGRVGGSQDRKMQREGLGACDSSE